MHSSLGVVQLYHTTIANVRFEKVVSILSGCFATNSKGGRGGFLFFLGTIFSWATALRW